MNVLILHNRYREPGGEERSVGELTALLRARGHEVELLERSSASLAGTAGRTRAAAAMLRGGAHPAGVRAAVERLGADVVHAHNIHPLLGPRALAAARDAGARVVMHLHNYRLFCAIGIGYRGGEHCTRCRGRNMLPGVRLRCRGELAEAAVYGVALSAHQERLVRNVDRFVIPSQAAAARLALFGLSLDNIDVLTNFLPADRFAERSRAEDGEYAIFAGRLVEEKGVETAIEATARNGVPLLVAGEGPEAERLQAHAKALGAPVRFAGRLPPSELQDALRRAAFALAPSRWDEPCPYAAIEAMAAGLPVLASAVGGLPEMVGPGAMVPAGDVDAWADAIGELWTDRELRGARGEDALRRARELFGEERFYSGLMNVYRSAGAAFDG